VTRPRLRCIIPSRFVKAGPPNIHFKDDLVAAISGASTPTGVPDMTCIDTSPQPAPAPARRAARLPLAPLAAALALLLGMGVPALLAPPAIIAPGDWHGNAAPSLVTRR